MHYDVFLSHSHEDSEFIKDLASRLENEAGLNVWLDQWELVPGRPWIQGMAIGIEQASSCAVFIGSSTPGAWFQREYNRALNRQAREPEFGVIPVLIPGGQPEQVQDFLELNTWVDFRNGLDDVNAFHRLVAGIKGEAPGRGNVIATKVNHRGKEIKGYYTIANEIYEQASKALQENQETLTPLLAGTQSADQVYPRMLEIFHKQRSRGFFRIKASYLEQKIEKLDNQDQLKSILLHLKENVENLLVLFYSTNDGTMPNKDQAVRKTAVIAGLGEEFLDIETAKALLEDYLENLRNRVEQIGQIVGTLQAMLE